MNGFFSKNSKKKSKTNLEIRQEAIRDGGKIYRDRADKNEDVFIRYNNDTDIGLTPNKPIFFTNNVWLNEYIRLIVDESESIITQYYISHNIEDNIDGGVEAIHFLDEDYHEIIVYCSIWSYHNMTAYLPELLAKYIYYGMLPKEINGISLDGAIRKLRIFTSNVDVANLYMKHLETAYSITVFLSNKKYDDRIIVKSNDVMVKMFWETLNIIQVPTSDESVKDICFRIHSYLKNNPKLFEELRKELSKRHMEFFDKNRAKDFALWFMNEYSIDIYNDIMHL